MLEFFQGIAATITGLSLLIAVVVLVIYPRLNYALKVIGIYAVIGACSDLLMLSFNYVSKNNIFLFHAYSVLEFFFLTIFFFQIFRDLGKNQNEKYFLAVGLVLMILNSLFLQPLDVFNSYSLTFVSLVAIAYCITFFLLSLDKANASIEFKTIKWLIITIFLYHCVSIIVLLFGNKIQTLPIELNRIIWTSRAIILLVIKLMVCFQFFRLFNHIQKTKLSNGR